MILEKLEFSVVRFNEMYAKYQQIENIEDVILIQSVKEALIQRFEYTVEVAWKTVKKYLESIGIVSGSSPKKVIRNAAREEILDGNNWIHFIDLRIMTSHDYSGEKLDDTLESMELFHNEVNKLLITLTQRLASDE